MRPTSNEPRCEHPRDGRLDSPTAQRCQELAGPTPRPPRSHARRPASTPRPPASSITCQGSASLDQRWWKGHVVTYSHACIPWGCPGPRSPRRLRSARLAARPRTHKAADSRTDSPPHPSRQPAPSPPGAARQAADSAHPAPEHGHEPKRGRRAQAATQRASPAPRRGEQATELTEAKGTSRGASPGLPAPASGEHAAQPLDEDEAQRRASKSQAAAVPSRRPSRLLLSSPRRRLGPLRTGEIKGKTTPPAGPPRRWGKTPGREGAGGGGEGGSVLAPPRPVTTRGCQTTTDRSRQKAP